ncbi:PD40 domain-containing protein [Shewanella sp. VB17]|uniref:PD40 domain-containing protein n=1 Tax=Shewanella sp. VB17 TaxID=2739432 RepID=UPI0015660B06|nr:PD40 domain-containing protein [Shewanella sp. VB17]NRD75278.1 PD40 domain-containing protein [Shewanella sp. VB17]
MLLKKRFIMGAVAAACMMTQTVNAETLLLQQPSIAKDKLAFVYAGDIYVADQQGQQVERITSHAASEYSPHLSPDGKWLAFTAGYSAFNCIRDICDE